MSLKDKHIVNVRSGVVYDGSGCNDCSAIFVGETRRQVEDRMKEHQADIIKNKPVPKVYMHSGTLQIQDPTPPSEMVYFHGRYAW